MPHNNLLTNLLKINAIRLSPDKPFTWASGWQSPIYCDNRKILSYPDVRQLVYQLFKQKAQQLFTGIDVIAGVATGAIAHGVLVAEALNLPFVYVRAAAKQHGLENLIEGHLPNGSRVLVIEDLISTGGSSLKAVDALRDTGAEVVGMLAIFSYGFEVAKHNFEQKQVTLHTLANYEQLIDRALQMGQITPEELEILKQWRIDPANWGK